jgi:hypothetical protein
MRCGWATLCAYQQQKTMAGFQISFITTQNIESANIKKVTKENRRVSQ